MADLPATTEQTRISLRASNGQPDVEHRVWIGGAVATLMAFYWQDSGRAPILSEEVLATWMDDLGGFPQPVIEGAIREWRQNERRKPCPADLIALCRARMPRPQVVREPEPERQRVTPEAAAEILAQTGWARRIVKRIPRSGDE